MKVTIGFDPGKEGAYAILFGEDRPKVGPFPFIGKELDLRMLYCVLVSHDVPREDIYLVIEKVHAMPGQGVTSMFTFGSGFGELKALAKILGYRWALVTPQEWKKNVLSGTDKSKGATVEWALRTYPSLQPDLLKKSGLAHMGKVDALAIAHWGHHFAKR